MAEPSALQRRGLRVQSALIDRGVALDTMVITRNQVRLASKQVRDGRTTVRVAERLLEIGDDVVEPLIGFFLDDDRARAVLKRMIDSLQPQSLSTERPLLHPRGDQHDLAPIMRQQAHAPWGIGEEVPVTWGPRRKKRRQRGIKVAGYDPRWPLIRIHRLLDDARVPGWYLGFVIFHEMLHHAIGVDRRDARGRRILHPPEFRRREREHPDHDRAMAFEREQLMQLLRLGLP